MIYAGLYIDESPGRGRGVFTAQALDAGMLVETSPVIVMSKEERYLRTRPCCMIIFLSGEPDPINAAWRWGMCRFITIRRMQIVIMRWIMRRH